MTGGKELAGSEDRDLEPEWSGWERVRARKA